mgnify:FL=1|jgi:hypothetical protein
MATKILFLLAFLVALASTAEAIPFIKYSGIALASTAEAIPIFFHSQNGASRRRAREEREKENHIQSMSTLTEINILHSESPYQMGMPFNKDFCPFIQNAFETGVPGGNLTHILNMPAHLKEDFVANVKDLFKKHAYTEKNFPRTYRPDMNITATIIDVLEYEKRYCGYKLGRKQPDLLDSINAVLVGLIIYFVIFR